MCYAGSSECIMSTILNLYIFNPFCGEFDIDVLYLSGVS